MNACSHISSSAYLSGGVSGDNTERVEGSFGILAGGLEMDVCRSSVIS